MAFNPAVELSYLKTEEQVLLLDAMESEQTTPSLSQAQRLKQFSQEGKLSVDVMRAIMSEEKKPEMDKVIFTGAKLRQYFPKSYTPQQMENTILRLLEQWQQKRQHEDNQCGITGSGQLISRSPFIRDGDCKKIGHKKTSLCAQEGTKNRTDKNLSHVPPYAGIIRFR